MARLPEQVLRSSLFSFVCEYAHVTPPDGFQPEALHLYLCRLIQKAINNNEKIIITVPPQHGKSMLASVYTPIWYLLRYPRRNIALISYSSDLAESKSLQARALAKLAINPKLSADVKNKANWSLQDTGDVSFRARGIGGAITGNPVDLLILDDLIKNHEEAESPTTRDKIWNFLESTIATRFTKNAACICILTRWHLDDYAFRLNKLWHWPIYNIPAICDDPETDLLGRELGEVAAPKLKPRAMMEEARRNTSAYVFNALYQGRPTSSESSRIKREWFKYFPAEQIDGISQKYNVYQTVDTSGKDSETADYFVILTFALVTKTITGVLIDTEQDYIRAQKNKVEMVKHIYILDVMRQKFTTTDHNIAMQTYREKWRPVTQYVESSVYGLNILDHGEKHKLPYSELQADGSKFLRSEQISVYYKNGQVYHPDNAEWLKAFEDEITGFPVAKHDDQFDCVSYAGIVAAKKRI